MLFADTIKRSDICTDPECFSRKRDTLVEIHLKEVEASGEKPLKVSDSHLFYGHKPLPGVLYRPDYHEATAGDCPTTTVAVVVEGNRAGTKLYICTNPKCKTHAAHSIGLSPEEKAERKKQAEALRVQQEYRRRLLEAVHKRVPAQLSRHELDLVALGYFNQLGHDSQHRIFKLFAWEAAKTKAANGGYVDYAKLASAKLDRMTTAEIGRFLVVCALASDLYCPAYASSTTLAKDSKLARTVAHYKVNWRRVLSDVAERLRKGSSNPKANSNHSASSAAKK